MATMNGGAACVEALAEAGVTHVFGLLGSSTMEVYDALYEHKSITYVGVRHEGFGTHMADGYGRAARRPGVFLAGQAGPGSANLVTGLAQAKLAYSPVVAITGLVATDHYNKDAFQEIDQQDLYASVVKKNLTVFRPDRIPEIITEAFRIANSGRRGPVAVHIPRDLFAASIDVEIGKPRDVMIMTLGTSNPQAVAKVRDLLLKAKAPAILAGAGVKWGDGAKEVCRLSNLLGIPVTASAGHPDVVPSDHPYFCGQVGPRGNEVASKATREADVILAIGTRLAFNTTFYTYNDINKAAKIIQIDIDPLALGKYFPVEMGIIGDAGSVAGAIADALAGVDASKLPSAGRGEQVKRDLKALWDQREKDGTSTSTPLKPDRVFAEIRKVLPRDTLITLDAGTNCLQATDKLKYYGSPSMLTPVDFGLVGFAFAAGLGARCARPDRTVISLMGDGGFGMTIAEFSTAVQSKIKTVTVVFDNGCWGAEKSYQRDFYNGRYIGCDVVNPRYDKFAELYGAAGYFADKPGEVSAALEAAIKQDKPAIVHVKVDPDAMVSFRRDAFKHRATR
ncbi:MAG: thiamine pyrophosphate-binding protein [Alphaproteobacteria bacterium]|nr:thiamine pyrophosphate-binding protein [Alphaproteobacteria bacterium]